MRRGIPVNFFFLSRSSRGVCVYSRRHRVHAAPPHITWRASPCVGQSLWSHLISFSADTCNNTCLQKRDAPSRLCAVLFVGGRVLHTPTAQIVSPLDALFDVSQISLMGDRASRWDWEYHLIIQTYRVLREETFLYFYFFALRKFNQNNSLYLAKNKLECLNFLNKIPNSTMAI